MVNRSYVLQVGDRLVTRRWGTRHGSSRYERIDELANKCVVYIATDAVVSISYSGIAFLESKPTDVWLAETLDADIAAGPHALFRTGGGSERRITLGAAIKRVASRLTHDMNALPASRRPSGLTLQLVGWQWHQRRPVPMPIMWHIANNGAGTETTISRLPRYWGWERNACHVAAIGDRRTDPVREVERRLTGINELYAEVVEQVLVETIRDASASNLTEETIGMDCISTWIRLSDGNIRIRYLPGSPASADYDVYTPWVVMPTVGASAPSVLTGGGSPVLHLGAIDVLFERAALRALLLFRPGAVRCGGLRSHKVKKWPPARVKSPCSSGVEEPRNPLPQARGGRLRNCRSVPVDGQGGPNGRICFQTGAPRRDAGRAANVLGRRTKLE